MCTRVCVHCSGPFLQQSISWSAGSTWVMGRQKAVTLSHHWTRASNDCPREIAASSNVLENISHPCLRFLHLLLAGTWRVSFWLMLSVRGSVLCTVLWNGGLVLHDAHGGNSITFLEDPNVRCAVTGEDLRRRTSPLCGCRAQGQCCYSTSLSN